MANAAKVQTALKLSEEDQTTIAALKKEIEKAWKLVDASHEKEARAKETIQQLKLEIANLSRLVEQGAGLSLGQENTVREIPRSTECVCLTWCTGFQSRLVTWTRFPTRRVDTASRPVPRGHVTLATRICLDSSQCVF